MSAVDATLPILKYCANMQDGWVPRAQLIAIFGDNATRLIRGRNERRSIFGRGFAQFVNGGVRITEAGRAFLQTIPSVRNGQADPT